MAGAIVQPVPAPVLTPTSYLDVTGAVPSITVISSGTNVNGVTILAFSGQVVNNSNVTFGNLDVDGPIRIPSGVAVTLETSVGELRLKVGSNQFKRSAASGFTGTASQVAASLACIIH